MQWLGVIFIEIAVYETFKLCANKWFILTKIICIELQYLKSWALTHLKIKLPTNYLLKKHV